MLKLSIVFYFHSTRL